MIILSIVLVALGGLAAGTLIGFTISEFRRKKNKANGK